MLVRLTTFALLLTFAVIVLGAATRVFDAGLSCPDWPHCYGLWFPFPEWRVDGGYMVDGTHYTWWQVALEWSHRGAAAMVGFLLLGVLLYMAGQRSRVWVPYIVTVLLLGLQVKLGAITVWLGNIHWSVALHLGVAMLFLASLAWLRRACVVGPWPIVPKPAWAWPATAMLALLVWATMVVGAFVSSGHAGGVCGGLFSCGGQWLPEDMAQLWHMKHRYLALATLLATLGYLVACKRAFTLNRKAARVLHIVVWVQAGLGVLTLYSFAGYPSWYHLLSVTHLAWGTVVWFIAVGAVLNLKYGAQGRFHG